MRSGDVSDNNGGHAARTVALLIADLYMNGNARMEVYRRALPEPSIGKLYSSLVLYVLYTVRLCTYAYSYKSKMLLVVFSLILSHRQLIVCTVK